LAHALQEERTTLRTRLGHLTDAERALGESQAEESGPGGDQADVASDLAEQELDLGLERAARVRLAEVEAALLRLKLGRYGTCENCGVAIEPTRLQALPWARFCLACAARQEQRH
jgi:DnaK suppressor protein